MSGTKSPKDKVTKPAAKPGKQRSTRGATARTSSTGRQEESEPSSSASDLVHTSTSSVWRPKNNRPFTSIVTVVVGPHAEEIFLYQHQATLCSKFFERALLNEHMVESDTGRVVLAEEDIDTVESFAHWLCHGDVPLDSATEVEKLIKCYIFAEKYIITDMCNTVIDQVARYMGYEHHFPFEVAHINAVFEFTQKHNLFRKLLVDGFVWRGSFTTLPDLEPSDFHADFFFECFKTVHRPFHDLRLGRTDSAYRPPYSQNLCIEYHDHSHDIAEYGYWKRSPHCRAPAAPILIESDEGGGDAEDV